MHVQISNGTIISIVYKWKGKAFQTTIYMEFTPQEHYIWCFNVFMRYLRMANRGKQVKLKRAFCLVELQQFLFRCFSFTTSYPIDRLNQCNVPTVSSLAKQHTCHSCDHLKDGCQSLTLPGNRSSSTGTD